MSSTADLLRRLQAHVRSEAETQYEALERQWSRPLAERVAKGWAIEGLHFVQRKNGILCMACYNNDSRFREGDLVVLHHGSPMETEALHLELQYDGETSLEFSLIKGNPFFLDARPDGWVLDEDWFDASPYYLNALEEVADSQRGRSIILPLLQGSLIPQIDYARFERSFQQMTAAGLNDSQAEAVGLAYAADLFHLIQGPPGTGKTWVLANLAKLLVDDGQRVLVTALTHRAIHNALNKIPRVDDSLPVCKIGGSQHKVDLEVPNYETFDESHFGDLAGGYIIGATPFALHTQKLQNVEFDVVLFDESSQVTLPLAIMGMLAGNKYIFIGDENQLPPVNVLSDQQISQSSIFAHLAGRGNETMLNITYRLNAALSEWPSRTFYNNLLKPSQQAAERRLQLSDQSLRWDFVLDPSSPAIFLDLCHKNSNVRSRREAEIVVELIISLLQHGLSPEEIGVVVPYRAQSRLIRSLLRRNIVDEGVWPRVAVDTVERMQGQEREVVLVSFATASPAFAAQMADFLFQPQRLNVAVTRPRTKLILVGSHEILKGENYDPDKKEVFALLRSLLEGCRVITLPEGTLV